MNSRTTKQFRTLLGALPAQVRQQAREAYRLFRQNASHPGLRFKKVVWFWIGSHADYDKLLEKL